MNLVFALAAAVLFGTGAVLLLDRDLVRVVLGVVLVSQAAVLTLVASGLTPRRGADLPAERGLHQRPAQSGDGADGDRDRPRRHRPPARPRPPGRPGLSLP